LVAAAAGGVSLTALDAIGVAGAGPAPSAAPATPAALPRPIPVLATACRGFPAGPRPIAVGDPPRLGLIEIVLVAVGTALARSVVLVAVIALRRDPARTGLEVLGVALLAAAIGAAFSDGALAVPAASAATAPAAPAAAGAGTIVRLTGFVAPGTGRPRATVVFGGGLLLRARDRLQPLADRLADRAPRLIVGTRAVGRGCRLPGRRQRLPRRWLVSPGNAKFGGE
jgi:hypothetical protein